MSRVGGSVALLRDREFAALAGTAFARSQAFSTILIALALYADAFGTTGLVEGLWGTGFALVQLLVVLPLGRKIDTGNAKAYLLAGFVLNLGVFAGFVFVDNAVHVVLVRMLQGLGASVLWITGSTVIGEISPDGEQGRWLGSYNQFGAISSLAGDVVGGYLLFAHGFTFTYAVLSAITVATFVLVWRFLRTNPGGRKDPEDAGGVETFRTLLARPMVRALVTFRFTFSVGKMAVIIFLPIYARTVFGFNALEIGWIMAGGKLTKALSQGYVGDLTDRLGRRYLFVTVGAGLYGLGTALIPLAAYFEGTVTPLRIDTFAGTTVIGGAFLTLFGAFGLLGVADSIRLPASMSLFVDEGAEYDAVASSMSLRSISWKVGQVVGPVLIGGVKEFVSAEAAFLAAAGFIVFATTVFGVTTIRAHRRERADPVPGD
ncbi:Predicted arabinose efflux permease, MFS family [Halomicrobium zhouii]|uniref:Predicted arabinose efflux permease, MFS family n=1 Tax=Halomicrobium zhouii TaxID=767519 RepID=A0A1I6LU88_9EURY|nr:MFS transporter [Halomicrobium zhouii]SFS07029.1 Predicted arabinose efflux permease, MFS family [Halomicrobium zhouii]